MINKALVASMLLLSFATAASADTILWTNITKHVRSRAKMNVDYNSCTKSLGVPMDGTPVSTAFKQCMFRNGWKFVSEDRNFDEIDGGKICHHGMFWGMPSVECKDL